MIENLLIFSKQEEPNVKYMTLEALGSRGRLIHTFPNRNVFIMNVKRVSSCSATHYPLGGAFFLDLVNPPGK